MTTTTILNNVPCEQRLAKLQRDFSALLISSGNHNVSLRAKQAGATATIKLVENGFRPKVAAAVAAKMRRSGRPSSHYSKTSGLLKQRIPAK